MGTETDEETERVDAEERLARIIAYAYSALAHVELQRTSRTLHDIILLAQGQEVAPSDFLRTLVAKFGSPDDNYADE